MSESCLGPVLTTGSYGNISYIRRFFVVHAAQAENITNNELHPIPKETTTKDPSFEKVD